MNLSYQRLEIYSILYIYLGVLIFILGWVRLIIAVPCAVIFLYLLYKNYFKIGEVVFDNILIRKSIVSVIVLGILAWLLASGIGGFCKQSGNWHKHNAILHDLITYNWPVRYILDNNENAMLSYYLLFYLFPAFVGKLCGFRCAEIVLFLQSALGIFLIYLHICYYLKLNTEKKQIGVFILLIIFGGNVLLGRWIYGYIHPEDLSLSFHWFSNTVRIQYSSHIVLIRWVFPQCIVPWLVTLMLLENPYKVEEFAWIGIPVFTYSCFAFVGLIPFFVILAFAQLYQNKNIIKWIRRILSAQNIYAIFLIMPIFVFYISGNIFQEKPDIVGFHFIDYSGNFGLYIIFCLSDFLIWSIFICKKELKNLIFYISNGILLCLPLFWFGTWNDLCMRASIPALFALALFFYRYILHFEIRKNIHKIQFALCTSMLFFSALPQVNELVKNARYFSVEGEYRSDNWLTLFGELVKDGTNDEVAYNYVTYNCNDSFFVKYFAK